MSQEKEKEAHEAAVHNSSKPDHGDECTIRTNAVPIQGNGAGNGGALPLGGPGSISDACETCSQHKTNSTSREGLHKISEGE